MSSKPQNFQRHKRLPLRLDRQIANVLTLSAAQFVQNDFALLLSIQDVHRPSFLQLNWRKLQNLVNHHGKYYTVAIIGLYFPLLKELPYPHDEQLTSEGTFFLNRYANQRNGDLQLCVG